MGDQCVNCSQTKNLIHEYGYIFCKTHHEEYEKYFCKCCDGCGWFLEVETVYRDTGNLYLCEECREELAWKQKS